MSLLNILRPQLRDVRGKVERVGPLMSEDSPNTLVVLLEGEKGVFLLSPGRHPTDESLGLIAAGDEIVAQVDDRRYINTASMRNLSLSKRLKQPG